MLFSLLALAVAVFTATKLVPAGLSKFEVSKQTDELFATLGGDRVRFMVGAAEVIGPILLLTPWTAAFGLAMILPVMVGAIYLHSFVWGNSPKNAVITLTSAILATAFWSL